VQERTRRRSALFALLTVLALVAVACGGNDKNDSSTGDTKTSTSEASGGKAGGTVLFAAEQEPTSLNWLTSADNAAWTQYIMGNVWPGTEYSKPDGSIVTNKDLVDSIELTNKSPQTVVYKINPKATWSDGTPISADDFKFYWEAQNGKNEAYDPASTTGYEDIQSVEGSDNGKTVTVTFAKAFADYKALFDYLFPAHAFKAAGGGDAVQGWVKGYQVETLDLAKTPIVSGGPYTVSEYKKGQSMTLVRNDKYWGTKGLLDKIVVPFITDATQQPAALENKEADVAFPQAQLDLVQQVQKIPGIKNTVGFGTFWEHLDLNMSNKHLASLAVRQAFGKALDRAEIVKRLPGQFSDKAQVLDNRIYFPGNKNYKAHGKDAGYANRDVAGAKKLLEGDGYTLGSDGIYAKGGDKLSIRLVWRDPNPRRQQTAQLIQAELKEAGFDIQLAPQPDFKFLDAGNFDVALFGWTGGTVLSSDTSIYVPGGGQNYTKNNDAKIKDLFDQANTELDETKRADLMNQIDEQLWKDVATYPLFQVPEFLAWRDTVIGPEYNGYQGPGWNAPQWSLK
jgi:peptide/nickel transport system substrate-binding protein